MFPDVAYTMESSGPRSFTVFIAPRGGGPRVPVGEVYDSFGPTVGVVWGDGAVGHPVTFGNREDAASWVAMKASTSGRIVL